MCSSIHALYLPHIHLEVHTTHSFLNSSVDNSESLLRVRLIELPKEETEGPNAARNNHV